MTQKALLNLAANDEAMDILREIQFEQRNLCHKTIYERKSATRRMKQLAAQIIDVLKGEPEHE